MKGSSVRYGTRFGCRWGLPHDFVQLRDAPTYKVEKCRLCGVRTKWNKGKGGRVDSPEYLKAHVRQFAQPNGSTKRVWAKLYKKQDCIIKL